VLVEDRVFERGGLPAKPTERRPSL